MIRIRSVAVLAGFCMLAVIQSCLQRRFEPIQTKTVELTGGAGITYRFSGDGESVYWECDAQGRKRLGTKQQLTKVLEERLQDLDTKIQLNQAALKDLEGSDEATGDMKALVTNTVNYLRKLREDFKKSQSAIMALMSSGAACSVIRNDPNNQGAVAVLETIATWAEKQQSTRTLRRFYDNPGVTFN